MVFMIIKTRYIENRKLNIVITDLNSIIMKSKSAIWMHSKIRIEAKHYEF